VSLLQVADSFYVGVREVATAASWPMDKLGLEQTKVDLDDSEGCLAFGFAQDHPVAIVIRPVSVAPDLGTHILHTHAMEKARKWLSFRGARVGPITTDPQGTRNFWLLDLESNTIEVSEEP
jgi:hypothetical protein